MNLINIFNLIMLNPNLIVIFIFGLITSYTDFKFGKIYNKYIVSVIIYSILYHILVCIIIGFKYSYFIDYFINIIIMFSIAFILFYADLWSAGDAKLLIAYSFLLTPNFIKYGYLGGNYGFIFIVNSFVVVLIYLILTGLFKIKLSEIKEAFKPFMNFKGIFSLLIFVYAFSSLLQYLNKILPFNFHTENYFLMILYLFIIFSTINKIFKKKYSIFGFMLIALISLFFDKNINNINYWIKLFSRAFLIIVFRILFIKIGIDAFTDKIKIKDLKPGMILKDKIIKIQTNNINDKNKINNIKFIKNNTIDFDLLMILTNKDDSFFKQIGYSGKLTKENIEKIKDMKKKGLISFETLRIAHTMPFAPILFIGCLITIILKGSIFYYLFK